MRLLTLLILLSLFLASCVSDEAFEGPDSSIQVFGWRPEQNQIVAVRYNVKMQDSLTLLVFDSSGTELENINIPSTFTSKDGFSDFLLFHSDRIHFFFQYGSNITLINSLDGTVQPFLPNSQLVDVSPLGSLIFIRSSGSEEHILGSVSGLNFTQIKSFSVGSPGTELEFAL